MSSEISESHFNMWRCVVALAHTDNRVESEEIAHMKPYFEKVPFSASQREQLNADFEAPQDPRPIFDLITDKVDRGKLIYYARLMFWSDGEFHHKEEELLNELQDKVNSQIDITQIMNDFNAQLDADMKESRNFREIVASLIDIF